MQSVRINHATTSIYQAEKPRSTTAPLEALPADLSASETTRKDSLAAISQKVKSPNSTSAIPF